MFENFILVLNSIKNTFGFLGLYILEYNHIVDILCEIRLGEPYLF